MAAKPTSIRLTDDERAMLEAVAAHQGMNVSTFVRQVALEMARAYLDMQGGLQNIADHNARTQIRRAEDMRTQLAALHRYTATANSAPQPAGRLATATDTTATDTTATDTTSRTKPAQPDEAPESNGK